MSEDVDLSRRRLTTRIHVFQSMETSIVNPCLYLSILIFRSEEIKLYVV